MHNYKFLLFACVILISTIASALADDIPDICLKAEHERMSSNPEGALPLFEECVQQEGMSDKQLGTAYALYGTVLYDVGRLEDGLTSLKRSINLRPNLAHAHYLIGIIQLERNQIDQAIESFSTSIALNPKQNMIYAYRGEAYLYANKFKLAEANFIQQLMITPNNPYIISFLGLSLAHLGEYEKALSAFEQAEKIGPEEPYIFIHKGTAYDLMGESGKARECLDRALELDSRSFNVINDIAWQLATARTPELRDGQKAVELAQSSLSQFEHFGNLDTLAAAYARTGNFDMAVKTMEKTLNMAEADGYNLTELQIRMDAYKGGNAWEPAPGEY